MARFFAYRVVQYGHIASRHVRDSTSPPAPCQLPGSIFDRSSMFLRTTVSALEIMEEGKRAPAGRVEPRSIRSKSNVVPFSPSPDRRITRRRWRCLTCLGHVPQARDTLVSSPTKWSICISNDLLWSQALPDEASV